MGMNINSGRVRTTLVDGEHVIHFAPDAAGAEIKRAVIAASTSGDNTLVAAVTGKKIKVLSLFLVAGGAVDVRFESAAGGTALTGVMSMAADGDQLVLPPASPGAHWFETAAGALLNLELSGAVSVAGALTYYEAA